MSGQLVQFLGSLAAILALAGIAAWLKLGPSLQLQDEEEARAAAREAVDGFEATEVALDRAGQGALLRDGEGRILLLRQHGTHLAGRLLGTAARAELADGRLYVHTAERRFGSAQLRIDDPQAWVQRIDAIG